ncbi:MAG: hypothetical protein KIT31_32825 [Deltaproteobacteria bacterium]|nr:hypothetical protein [Deltaproteobacteria bacterium]
MTASAALVFAALFLPAGDGCNASPLVPVSHGAAYPPHLLGALVLAILFAPRAAEGFVYAIRLLVWLVIGVAIVVMLPLQHTPLHLRGAPLVLGTGIIAIVGLGSLSALTLSRTVLGAALTALAWFIVQSADPGTSSALGAYLGAAGAAGLLACALAWCRDALRTRAEQLAKP